MRKAVVFTIIISMAACKPASSEKEKALKDFETVDQSLQPQPVKTDKAILALYDSVAQKYGEQFLQQFQYTITDCKANLANLKQQFIRFCGDSTGSNLPADKYDRADLTNSFFAKEENGPTLYLQLMEVQQTLASHNDDPALDDTIRTMTGVQAAGGAASFMKTYFHDVPPVAALTILSKFENSIPALEQKVLLGILKENNVIKK